MKFDSKYFNETRFTKKQIKSYFDNCLKDLSISKKDKILDVKFNYIYTAFIKAGISLLAHYQIKIKSRPGHHIKIIEKMSEILKDDDISDIGNAIRSKRNLDLYCGGVDVTSKECKDYILFVENVVGRVKEIIFKK